MKDPLFVVTFSVVEREEFNYANIEPPEVKGHLSLDGLHLIRLYHMKDVLLSAHPLGPRIAAEADKMWESAVMMGVLEK